jgi:CRISPR-associated exonuclease Cas4
MGENKKCYLKDEIQGEATYNEEDLIQLSSLQHYLFCKRQCALIHIEQVWDENRFTVEGKILHERVDNLTSESRKNFKVEFSVPIRSLKLGLIGKADVVEFNKVENCWIPYPVEYKHGKPKIEDCDKVQLCAQAICLEEMMRIKIDEGAIFYGIPHKRQIVHFDDDLREKTSLVSKEVHLLIENGKTPKAEFRHQCKQCSLFELCLPKKSYSVEGYLKKMLDELSK